MRQNDRSDCGAAALASVAAHKGIYLPLSEIRHYSGTDAGGTTLRGLIEAARRFGLNAEGYKGSAESLPKIPKPAILHLRKEEGYLHYVVLSRNSGKKYHIMDPADGSLTATTEEKLCSEWTGYLILFEGSSNRDKANKGIKFSPVIAALWRQVISHKKEIITIIILTLINTAIALSLAIFIKELTDTVIPSGNPAKVAKFAMVLSIVVISGVLLSVFRSQFALKFALKADITLINRYLNHLYHMPLPYFSTFRIGELTSRITDAYRVRELIADRLPGAAIALLTLALSIIVLGFTDKKLTLLCSLFMPLYIAVYYLHDRINRPLMKKSMESSALFQSSVIESIRSVATLKNFGLEKIAANKNSVRLTQFCKTLEKSGKTAVVAGGASDFVSKALMVSLLWVGGVAVASNQITLGQLLAFYSVTALFSTPLQQLASTLSGIREGIISAHRLFDLMEIKRELPECEEFQNIKEAVASSSRNNLKLCLKNISYKYPGKASLIENLSFEAASGTLILIKGASGCGKSTLLSLIMRHFEPDKGEIEIDGKPISTISLKQWRQMVAMVPQDPGLFGETVQECILPGVPEWMDKERAADKLKELADKLGMEPLNTRIGEGGTWLSRGQQQRVAFARAIIRESPVLLLDEATSSLDLQSKRVIEGAVQQVLSQGCIVIMISHEETLLLKPNKVINIGGYKY